MHIMKGKVRFKKNKTSMSNILIFAIMKYNIVSKIQFSRFSKQREIVAHMGCSC